MIYSKAIPWQDPVAIWWAETDLNPTHVFLHSSQQTPYSGRYSYLALFPQNQQEKLDWDGLDRLLQEHSGDNLIDAWWVLMTYEEDINALNFDVVYEWDHQQQTLHVHSRNPYTVPEAQTPPETPLRPKLSPFSSNMSKSDYLNKVQDALDEIHAGTFYQVNLTRKFCAQLESPGPDTLRQCFLNLIESSPAPYSAYIVLDGLTVLSSSPEQFLKAQNGQWESRPIKGTRSRNQDSDKCHDEANALKESAKDQAENLMIVDLMRHDFSTFCQPGTVKVPALFQVNSHKTLHHMSSLIVGQQDPKKSMVQAIRSCFPPGSMTGTPKAKAIDYAHRYEKRPRGLYSGAIGYLLADRAELSVVIRTLIATGNRIEFQVGGAIVADSKPELEWHETLVKAKGISQALGIDPFVDLAF